MRGLLIKDYHLLTGRRNFFLMVIALGIIFIGVYENPAFPVGYMTILMTIFSMSTISYDEFENGMAFLMTLPVGRKCYVREKYVFSILCAGITAVLSTILTIVIAAGRNAGIDYKETVMIGICIIGVAVLIVSVMIPIEIKFGVERGRTAMGIIAGVSCLLAFVVSYFAEKLPTDVTAVAEVFTQAKQSILVIFCVLFLIIVVICSYLLSVRFMEKKEF